MGVWDEVYGWGEVGEVCFGEWNELCWGWDGWWKGELGGEGRFVVLCGSMAC